MGEGLAARVPSDDEDDYESPEDFEQKAERLSVELYAILITELDIFQNRVGDNSGFPGEVEFLLREKINEFGRRYSLPLVDEKTFSAGIRDVTGSIGNCAGFAFPNAEGSGVENIPIYSNSAAPPLPRYSDRLQPENIGKAVRILLNRKEK